MPKIVTTSELQKQIGNLISWISRTVVIVTNRGRAKVVMLPYFDENDDAIADYLEEYEMRKNYPALKERWQKSLGSGISDLTV